MKDCTFCLRALGCTLCGAPYCNSVALLAVQIYNGGRVVTGELRRAASAVCAGYDLLNDAPMRSTRWRACVGVCE